MKPDLSRSDQVVARVVAWHNRHPLARKISADQVHSVGVVSLPFAVRGARVEPISLALPAQPVSPAPIVIELPAPADDDASPSPADGAATEVELVVDPPAEPPLAAAESAPAAPEPAPPVADAADPGPRGPAGERPLVTVLATRAAQLPPRPRAWHPLTWWQQWRGRPVFRPLFSEDFIAPLRPRQVARWAAAHGVGTRPLEPQAQQRLVMLDAARRRAGDDAPEVDLHLITAAIGVGDERKRLLLAPGSSGQILGPRYWDRPRVAAAAGTTLALGAACAAGLLWKAEAVDLLALLRPGKAEVAAVAAPPASAASALAAHAASTPASASRLASHPASAPTALVAASAVDAPPVAQAAAVARTASAAVASASTPASAPVSVAAASPVTPRVAEAPAASAAQAAAPIDPPRPESVRPRRGRIDIQPLVPPLADADRQALRAEARQLRGPEPAAAAAAAPKAKAWALVTRPIGDRRQSERLAAQMQAVALLQPVPMRAELMQAGRGWRAAVWPFQTAKDAEKVRLALADKGLRTEVVEF